jgi:hypothetical protein
MKILSLSAISILLLCNAALAQHPDYAGIGLYTDPNDPPSVESACVTGVGFYFVEMYIWCLPEASQWTHGVLCAEFAISYPDNVIQSTVTINTDIRSVDLGTLPTGYSICYKSCQDYWHWIAHQSLYVTNAEPSWIEIVKHPDPCITDVQYAPCDDT